MTDNPLVLPILGALFTLILGSYKYSHSIRREVTKLWQAFHAFRDNEVKHIEERLDKLEDKE